MQHLMEAKLKQLKAKKDEEDRRKKEKRRLPRRQVCPLSVSQPLSVGYLYQPSFSTLHPPLFLIHACKYRHSEALSHAPFGAKGADLRVVH